MIRLTTPTHVWVFETDPNDYERILISYAQNGRILLEKEKEDLTVKQKTADGEIVWEASFRLTQEETRRFDADGTEVRAQVRVLTGTGDAMASEVYRIKVSEVLNEEVMA